ncbi:MAG: DUF4214 domain-containing protein, partial [Pseudomonadota bacterium]
AAPRTEVSPGQPTITVTYDVLGNAVSNQDVGGAVSYKVYDRLGQVRYDVDANGYVTGYEHDSFGAVTRLTRYATALPDYASFAANAANRTAAVVGTRLAARAGVDSAGDRTITTRYDQLGHAVKVTEPLVAVYDEHALNGVTNFQSARTTETRYDAFGEARQVLVYGADSAGVRLTAAASTRYYYDANGNKTAQIATLQDDAAGRSGYLTTFDYDAAGSLLTQTEYATLYGDWQADWKDTRYGVPAKDSATDRVSSYVYDANGRKTREAHNGAATSYGYDALGNITRTTDALGGASYSYYDVLGRVSAVAAASANTAGSLTEFRRDLYGNVVVRIDYANGAPAGTTTAARPVAAADPAKDRTTLTSYDNAGHATQVIDAEGKYSFTSYDIYGRVAKQWRTVTNAADPVNSVETSYVITTYDKLGRQLSVTRPGVIDLVRNILAPAPTVQSYAYNAFGESTQVSTTGAGAATQTQYTRYDNAGHAWLSNAGDGIDKLSLFDAQGNVVSTMVRSGTTTDFPLNLTNAGDVAGALAQTGMQRTDYSYDLMGRQIDVRQDRNAQLYAMVRDAKTGTWSRTPQSGSNLQQDSLLLVSDASEKGTAVSVAYRLAGSADWIDGGSRVQAAGDSRVFSSAGLAAGRYEYKVTLKPAGEPEFVRTQGSLQIAVANSNLKNMQLARIYGLLLNRAPDLAGLNYYIDRANKGESLAHLVLDFLRSSEALVFLGGSSADAIKRLLNNGFGRDGVNLSTDPTYADDVAKWAAAYDQAKSAGGDATGQMMLDMIEVMLQPVDTGLPAAAQAALTKAQTRMNNGVTAGIAYAMTYMGTAQDSAARIWKESATSLDLAVQDAKDSGTMETQRIKISQAYLALFGRAAEKAGMDFWLQGLKTLSPEQMVGGMLDSPEAQNPLLYPVIGVDDAAYNTQLMTRVFQNLRGRPPTADEVVRWNGVLPTAADTGIEKSRKHGDFVMQLAAEVSNYAGKDSALLAQKQQFNTKLTLALSYAKLDLSGVPAADQQSMGGALFAAVASGDSAKAAVDKTIATVAANATAAAALSAAASAAAGSTSLEDMRAQLARLYVALLNRTPDSDGLAYNLDLLQRNNGSPSMWILIANNLINSAESKADSTLTAVPPLSDAAFVERVYTLAVGEKPASAGARQEMDVFAKQLAAGGSRGEVALNIVNGLLSYKNLTAKDAELKAKFNNKVGVALACAVNLSAFGWGGNGNIGQARAVLNAVTATDIKVALGTAYDLARTAYVTGSQSTLDAAAQARSTVDNNAAAVAASLLAKGGVNTALSTAQAQPTAMVRLQLMQMYVGLLGRTVATYNANPDLAGLEFQVDQSKIAGMTMGRIAQGFLDSSDGLKLYGNITDPVAFVSKIYSTVLGGASPDLNLINNWAAKLGGPSPMTRGEVAFGILGEVQNYANVAPDAAARNFMSARQGFLQRVSDCFAVVNAAEQAAITAYATAKSAQDQLGKSLAGLLSTRDQDNITKNAAVTAASNAIDAASGTAKLRLQLTLLYATILQRKVAPQQFELDYYITGAGSGTSIEHVAQVFVEGGLQGYPTDNRAFVSTLYARIMGRTTPTPEEIDFWASRITGAADSRGTVAWQMLTSYMNYSDSKPGELQRKAQFDNTIASFINTELNDANAIAFNAWSDWKTKNQTTGDAYIAWQAAVKAVTDTNTLITQIGGSQAYKDAVDFQAALSGGKQNLVTFLYLGIRGTGSKHDLSGMAWQMTHYSSYPSQADFVSAVITALINEPDSTLPHGTADAKAFVQALYLRALGRAATATNINDWLTKGYTIPKIADEILKLQEAVNYLTPYVNARAVEDRASTQQLIDSY